MWTAKMMTTNRSDRNKTKWTQYVILFQSCDEMMKPAMTKLKLNHDVAIFEAQLLHLN